MPWVRIDADAPLHPKIIQVGIAGFGFFVAGLCYANHYLTDGFIPVHALVAVFPGITHGRALALAVKLCEAGLWEKQDSPDGWVIHDYHHYQPTKESVLAQRDQAHLSRVAGGKIRAARAPRMAGRFTTSGTSCPPAALQLPHQLDTSPVPVPVPVLESKSTTLSGSHSGTRPIPPFRQDAKAVLAFLNQKTGRRYRENETNLRFIEGRLKDGATVEQCRGVIARKWREWGTDPKMTDYVRPATLFNATKFEQYLGQQGAAHEVLS